jgi:NAD(P)-dependent dehydrogenase (short-subunit alcohol dehydrogenase family)
VPLLAEQTILVTGATDGLGRETARALARRGMTVLVHARDPEKGEQTLRWIREQTGNQRLRLYVADFASLSDVRRLAADVTREAEYLQVLVNNAGVGGLRERQVSRDGYELHFAVNYLAPFLLTRLMLPLLERSAPARVINVASAAQTPIDFGDVMLEHDYDRDRAYEQSKLAQVMDTFELAERLRAEGKPGISVTALHPASLMDTKMVRGWFDRPLTSVAEGVEALVRLVVSDEAEGRSGRYFDGLEEARANEQAYDPAARRRLWELSEELVSGSSGPHGTGSAAPGRERSR